MMIFGTMHTLPFYRIRQSKCQGLSNYKTATGSVNSKRRDSFRLGCSCRLVAVFMPHGVIPAPSIHQKHRLYPACGRSPAEDLDVARSRGAAHAEPLDDL